MLEFTLLFIAGVIGGVLNAIAGGGTFFTFPALVLVGVPPVAANATSTVAALPGYLAATLGFRREMSQLPRASLLRLTIWTMIGGAIGCLLLIFSSNGAFSALVPFLLLAATVLFYWSEPIRKHASQWRRAVTPFGLASLLPMAIYGGYFNGGLGIVMLAVFAMWGMSDLHLMNGLKSWLSFALSLVAVVIFAGGGKIVWLPCAFLAAGTIVGGFAGPPVARRISRKKLRLLIAVVGFGMTAIFFWRLVKGV